jgi:hypothetical protein
MLYIYGQQFYLHKIINIKDINHKKITKLLTI